MVAHTHAFAFRPQVVRLARARVGTTSAAERPSICEMRFTPYCYSCAWAANGSVRGGKLLQNTGSVVCRRAFFFASASLLLRRGGDTRRLVRGAVLASHHVATASTKKWRGGGPKGPDGERMGLQRLKILFKAERRQSHSTGRPLLHSTRIFIAFVPVLRVFHFSSRNMCSGFGSALPFSPLCSISKVGACWPFLRHSALSRLSLQTYPACFGGLSRLKTIAV